MSKNKTGFTMAEVLVSMVIIGIVMAISIQTIRIIKASYTSLTYFAFENLKGMVTAVYSSGGLEAQSGKSGIIATSSDGSITELDSATSKCMLRENKKIVSILKGLELVDENKTPYCSELKDEEDSTQSTIFCESMAAISNTAGAINCSQLYELKTTDQGEPIVNADYEKDTPNFRTTNGQKYYISQWDYKSDISSEYGYRVVAIDLTGDANPNIAEVKGKKYPDVVNFVIFDNGEIFPVGVAADNVALGDKKIHYLSSRVKGYYYTYNEERTENIPAECNISYTIDGNTTTNKTCNYGVVLIENDQETISGNPIRVFSYRQGYCVSLNGETPTYEDYCSDVTLSEKAKYCPPSSDASAFDLCLVETIKPAFRYNLK